MTFPFNNYPPGVTGNEWQITGEDPPEVEEVVIECQWFAGCHREATLDRTHPILGDVPICAECDEWCRRMET